MPKYTDANIPNLEEDWGKSTVDSLPYSGKAVQKFIKDQIKALEEKLSVKADNVRLVQGAEDNSKYAIVLEATGSDGVVHEIGRTAEFNIGDTSNMTSISLKRVSTENPVLKIGDRATFTFFYDHVDGSGASTGMGATAVVTITHGSTRNSYSLNLTPGRNYTIDPTQYLIEGSNTIRVTVTTNDTDNPVTSNIQWTAIVTELSLSSEFDITNGGRPITRGDVLSIDYGIKGTGNVTTYLYIDSKREDSRVGITNSGLFTVNTSALSKGVHTIQLVSELDNAGTILKSNSIQYVITVTDETLEPSLALRFDYPDGRIIEGITAVLLAEQYSEFVLPYSVCKPANTGTSLVANEATAQIYVGGQTLSTATLKNSYAEFSYKFTESGVKQATLYAIDPNDISKNISFTFDIEIARSAVSVAEPEGNVELILSAIGKTNTGLDKDSWSYGNVRTTFEGVSFENGSDGWSTDENTLNALTVANNGKAIIGYKPFDISNATNEAFSFVVRFKSDVVTNDDGAIIDIMSDNGRGLKITSQEATIVTSNNTSITRKFAYGTEYEVAIVSNIIASNNSSAYIKKHSGMLYMYINGELCGAIQKGTGESIFHNNAKNIVISGEHARTSVYAIRAYRRSLTPDEVLNLYMIDLGDNTKMLEIYEKNDIADESGNVTIDKVKALGTVPYMIITGTANDMATVIYAATMNNKKSKYDLYQDANTLGEILYVNPLIPSSNFKLIGGCIRLQGTSSLVYPVKNYRIYFKDSNKVAGELYLGCDEFGEGGELQEKPKYALRGYSGETPSIPVDCFCLKADYAESSSSHNTGFAVLVNNVLKNAAEYTPAQKYKSASYKYDVRTTVDGFPLYLFYRKTLAETPTFLGKFNFNNDKSTEAVFGFLDIPGYHINEDGTPSDWIMDKFNGQNPTECWEFKDNSHSMGGFHFTKNSYDNTKKDYSFESYYTVKDEDGNEIRKYDWLDCWEARFPDDDDRNAAFESGKEKPTYLETVATWISSTDTSVAGLNAADINERKRKFATELGNYFDIDYLCDYYISTVIIAAVDQQIKNMMLGFWYNPDAVEVPKMGKVRGYFIFYDNDTILGVRNDGVLQFNWDIDENTIDPEYGTLAFAGARSTLWVNLRTQFPNKIREAYIRLRSETRFDPSTLYTAFTVNQTDKFPERMYNIDSVNKYIVPATEGVLNDKGEYVKTQNYLPLLQGSRKYHRNWWVGNRFDMLDALYAGTDYTAYQINFKAEDDSQPPHYIRIVSAREWYYAAVQGSDNPSITEKIAADDTWEYTYNGTHAIGNVWHIFGVKFAKSIDFSRFSKNLTQITFSRKLQYVEEFILGSTSSAIEEYKTSNFDIGDNMPLLRKIQVAKHTALPRLDLGQCSQIEEFDCTGCTSMVNVVLPTTATLKRAHYGSGIQTITLVNKKNVESIVADSFNNITDITLDGSNEACVDFVFDILITKFA